MADFEAALKADIERFAVAAKPLITALNRAYVRGSYVQMAMFADMVSGRTPGPVRQYLTAGGFTTTKETTTDG